MKRGRSLCTSLAELSFALELLAWTARGYVPHSALQSYVFEATLLVPNGDLLFPMANGRSLFEISNNGSDYQFEKRQVQAFPDGSTLYYTTTTLWRRQVQLCSGPLSVCTAPSGYYYGLPQPSALKCVSSGVPITPHRFRQYEMAIMNYFITRRNYAQLDTSGTTIVTIPLLGTHTFTTPTTGAVLLQTFEIIVFPGEAFDTCNFAQDGEEGSMRHVYASLDGYKRYTLDFLWTYVRPVNIVVDISCGAWFSYTPEALHHKTQVNLKLNISLVRDPAISFPELHGDQLILLPGTRVASFLVEVHSLYKPIELLVEGKSGRALAQLSSLTATIATYSVSWDKATRGRYRVLAKNSRGQSETRNITVTIATAPQVLVDLAEARVGEGASIPLVCVVISSIPVAVNWTRNYLPLSLGQDVAQVKPQYLTKHQTGLELTLSSVQPSDSGTYVCTASNSAGTVYKEVQLLVYHQGSFQIDELYGGPHSVIADTHIEAVLVPIPSYPATTHTAFLIGGTSLAVATVLLIPISLALARLLISCCRRGIGRGQSKKEGDHRVDSLDTHDSSGSSGVDETTKL